MSATTHATSDTETAEHALAQLAATGSLEQVGDLRALADAVHPSFLARAAVYAREHAGLRDTAALLLAMLSKASPPLFAAVFDRVVDDMRTLLRFVSILRSGLTGRRSLGTRPKRLVRRWLERRTCDELFLASAGGDRVGEGLGLAEVIKLTHPRPHDAERRAFYGYLLGRPVDLASLPPVVLDYERFRRGQRQALPEAPLERLTACALTPPQWAELACRADWQEARTHLNAFARHGAFDVPGTTEAVAYVLRNPAAMRQGRARPREALLAWQACQDVPQPVKDALHAAMTYLIREGPPLNTPCCHRVDAIRKVALEEAPAA